LNNLYNVYVADCLQANEWVFERLMYMDEQKLQILFLLSFILVITFKVSPHTVTLQKPYAVISVLLCSPQLHALVIVRIQIHHKKKSPYFINKIINAQIENA